MEDNFKLSQYLEKDIRDGRMLLVNCSNPRPLMFSDGIDYVQRYIDDYDKIKNRDMDLEDLLKKHKIIVDKEDSIIKPSPSDKKSIALYLLINQSCNLDCIYCLAGKEKYKSNKKMSFEVAIQAIEKAAREITENDTLQIIFFGGEPLLNNSIIHKIVKAVNTDIKNKFPKIKFHFHVTTNLTKLNQQDIDLFKNNNFSLLSNLDGRQIEHDKTRLYLNGKSSFSKTYKNVKEISRNDINLAIRATITSLNIDTLDEIYNYFKDDLEIKFQGFPMLIPIDSDGQIISQELYPDIEKFKNFVKNNLINSIKDGVYLSPMIEVLESIVFNYKQFYGCGMAIGNTFVVCAEGEVYPCIYLVGNDKYYIGNVNDSSMQFKYYSPELEIDEIENCNICKYRYFCGSGCLICEIMLKDKDKKAYEYFRNLTCELFKVSFIEVCWALCEQRININDSGENMFHNCKINDKVITKR